MKSRYLVVVLICFTLLLLSMGVYLIPHAYTLFTRKNTTQVIAEIPVEEYEIDFLWKSLALNGTVPNVQTPRPQKLAKLEELAKESEQKLARLCRQVNKYGTFMGDQWFLRFGATCAKSLQWKVSDKILFVPLYPDLIHTIQSDVETKLRQEGVLQQNMNFSDFNHYLFIYDDQYTTLSEKYFEYDTNQEKPIQYTELFDAIITSDAEARGFVRKKPIDTELLTFLPGGIQLKKQAAAAFLQLQQAAHQEGVDFDIISGYRGVEQQKTIFTQEMVRYGVSLWKLQDEVYVNNADTRQRIAKALDRVAPPGYSRHHTGLAIDLYQSGISDFSKTPAFAWLSANNYARAKQFGFLPSYPKLEARTAAYGPNPESWEYFYVGTELTHDQFSN